MSRAFVLGNGISRLQVDLITLKQEGKVYGCNALYREFVPDVLVSTDKGISHEIQNSGYAEKHLMYTRNPLPGLGAKNVPQKYFGYSSGPIALALAAEAEHTVIYIVGFDMGPNQNGKFNNVYADTEFYKKSSASPTYTGNWARQMSMVMRNYMHKNFIRIIGPTTSQVQEFSKVSNLISMTMPDFLERVRDNKL
jgi:hypothetical protein